MENQTVKTLSARCGRSAMRTCPHLRAPRVGDVILPLVVLRRLDEVLAPTKQKVLDKAEASSPNQTMRLTCLPTPQGRELSNTSKFDLPTLVEQDPENLLDNTP